MPVFAIGCSDLTKKTAPGRSLRRPREPGSVKARDGRLRENAPMTGLCLK